MNYDGNNDYLEGEREKARLRAENLRPRLLLHSCCAPCSSHVIGVLKEQFDLTVFYYNPNISPKEEYEKRKAEQIRLLGVLGIPYLECDYEGERYETAVRGLEKEPERGARCTVCFRLRLSRTVEVAKAENFPYFCTTLTVSPYKNAPLLNRIGRECQEEYGVRWLPSDFKKQNGYLHSVKLSEEYGLYRQDYCGCVYSKEERERQKALRREEKL